MNRQQTLRVSCWLHRQHPLRFSCRLLSLLWWWAADYRDSLPWGRVGDSAAFSEGELLTTRTASPEVELPTIQHFLRVNCWLQRQHPLRLSCRLLSLLWGWAADYEQTAYPEGELLTIKPSLRVSCWLWTDSIPEGELPTIKPSLRVSCWLWTDSIPRGWAVEQRLWRMTMHICGEHNLHCVENFVHVVMYVFAPRALLSWWPVHR